MFEINYLNEPLVAQSADQSVTEQPVYEHHSHNPNGVETFALLSISSAVAFACAALAKHVKR